MSGNDSGVSNYTAANISTIEAKYKINQASLHFWHAFKKKGIMRAFS